MLRILLAIDGFKFSKAATQMVMAQARLSEDEVRVVNVVDILPPVFQEMRQYYPGVEHARDAQRKPAEGLVTKTAELLRSMGLQVTTAVEWGSPKAKIIDSAAEWRADLIVLGSHGRTGLDRFLMGSLPVAVLRHAHCSVELVRIPSISKGSKRTGAPPDGTFKRILLATDDSKCSQAALRLLSEQVRPNETEVRVFHVVEQLPLVVVGEMGVPAPDLEGLLQAQTKQAAEDLVAKTAETLRTKNVKVTTALLRGNPKTKILDAAKQWKAELIVVGSLGRSGLERFVMGSVSDAVACHAHCSVEVVRICSGL